MSLPLCAVAFSLLQLEIEDVEKALTHRPPPPTPLPKSRFRVSFLVLLESILSRDSKTTRNRLPGREVGCGVNDQSAPKERRRGRAEKWLSKGCFWRVRFFSAPLMFALKTPESS